MSQEIQDPDGYGEMWYDDRIVVLHRGPNETNLSSLSDATRKGGSDIEDYSEPLQLSVDKYELTATKVFWLRFFERKSFVEIAEFFEMRAATVQQYYYRVAGKIERLIHVLDSRDSALKHLERGNFAKFSNDEKVFLLSHVFGFKLREVAELVGDNNYRYTAMKARRLEKKYRTAFDTIGV